MSEVGSQKLFSGPAEIYSGRVIGIRLGQPLRLPAERSLVKTGI